MLLSDKDLDLDVYLKDVSQNTGQDSVSKDSHFSFQLNRDLKDREDLRDLLVFSVTDVGVPGVYPQNAFSVSACGEDIYEIGLHVADVRHFVANDSPVDRRAKQRISVI